MNDNLSDEKVIVDKKKKFNWKVLVGIISIIITIGVIVLGIYFTNKNKATKENNTTTKQFNSEYKMTGNGLQKFDLYFLKEENNGKNIVYSPLSIKYALEMLSEGASGDTKGQIDAVIGNYVNKTYTNSSNMSFANSLFIKESYKNNIKEDYMTTLKNRYNADVVFDDFKTPYNLNKWVSDKTFKLIDNLFDDNIKELDFVLINALAIDMEWINVIREEWKDFEIDYTHEKYSKYISDLGAHGYDKLDFNNGFFAQSLEIGAVANKYDILKTLGEEKIKSTVKEAYKKWLQEYPESPRLILYDKDYNYVEYDNIDDYLKEYIRGLDSNYKQIDSSTDFMFYEDVGVKAFAKDLKTYDGVTLEYIAIEPKDISLKEYIKNINENNLNEIINNLKEIKLDSFEEGYITEIKGFIPMFKFDYELKLMDDLKSIGIKDVFDQKKSNLSNLTKDSAYIDTALHKATIEFSNEGIKAAAATALGGKGNAFGPVFTYDFDVPVKEIDLTFDKPYLFLIRDKDSGEIWFAGTVYEPNKYEDIVYKP